MARDLNRQIAAEHELEIISGKVARDHVHVFLSYRPNQDVSQIMQWLKGISSRVLLQELPHLRKRFWGRHFWLADILRSVRERSLMRWSRSTLKSRKVSRSLMIVDFQSTAFESLGL